MNAISINILLIENNPTDAGLIQGALANTTGSLFHVEWVTSLVDGLVRLGKGGIEVILLDLNLPDGQGLQAFDQVIEAEPDALILVMSGATDDEVAQQALSRGAQDYISKKHIDAHWLPRALHYMIERTITRRALHSSETRFRAISDASPLGIFVADGQGSCIYTNAAYQKISGLSFEQTLGTEWITAIHPEDRVDVLDEWRSAAKGQEPFQTEYRFLQHDGTIVWTRVSSAPIVDLKKTDGRIKIVEDISERKATEFRLRELEDTLFDEKERIQITLDSIGDAVLSTDIKGNITYMNRVAETLTGWSQKDALDRPLMEVFNIVDGVTRQTASNPALRTINENRRINLGNNCILIRRDGFESAIEDSTTPIHARNGQVAGAVIVFHDVSESRAMSLKLSHLAQHDFLTGLPNRLLLADRLTRSIGLARRHRKQVALLFLDLDYFKNINDSLGHATGDKLLQSVGERLVSIVRTTDTVCRQGGDEFVILLSEIEHPNDATLISEKLILAFSAPHSICGKDIYITLSIGISVYPDDGADLDAIIQNADTAMYYAKANGRNNYKFFRPEMNTRSARRLQVENNLRRAIEHNEFVLYYQPQVELSTGLITGAEALIRWVDPELGVIPPRHFITVAEECGLIVPIGRWVIREVCRQIKLWQVSGLGVVPVSVNVSDVEFRSKGFLAYLGLIVSETGIEPRYVELELTESLLMYDVEASISMLAELESMGFKLAIDDLGTGYSNLSYLKRFPVNTLKIDQSFVRDIVTDVSGATIVSSVIGMGNTMNHRVIAEGVETHEQFSFLSSQQCPQGQGFLFSKPLIAEEFARLLVTGCIDLPS